MGSEIKKKGLNLIFCVKLIVTTYISSLLALLLIMIPIFVILFLVMTYFRHYL